MWLKLQKRGGQLFQSKCFQNTTSACEDIDACVGCTWSDMLKTSQVPVALPASQEFASDLAGVCAGLGSKDRYNPICCLLPYFWPSSATSALAGGAMGAKQNCVIC